MAEWACVGAVCRGNLDGGQALGFWILTPLTATPHPLTPKRFLDLLPLSHYTTGMHAAQLHFRHPTGEISGILYPSYTTGRKSVSHYQ